MIQEYISKLQQSCEEMHLFPNDRELSIWNDHPDIKCTHNPFDVQSKNYLSEVTGYAVYPGHPFFWNFWWNKESTVAQWDVFSPISVTEYLSNLTSVNF